MLRVIFTSDYEIHGNGEGAPQALMVDNTHRNLQLFDEFGARLTIMADVAEIERFGRYFQETGEDRFASTAIGGQLQGALQSGHDVQLHIHPSYYEAAWEHGRWEQKYGDYDLARLGYRRLAEMIEHGKQFLEDLLRPVDPMYRCWVFRAANWSMQPSTDILRALVENGIRIDTSVFKYGRRAGLVAFDYAGAWSDVVPWPVSPEDVCARDPDGTLFECPIYSEARLPLAFLSWGRLARLWTSQRHRLGGGKLPRPSWWDWARALWHRHAWKLDFNQCSSRQLIEGIERAAAKVGTARCDVPIVLIGHSKLFDERNSRSLRPLLAHLRDRTDRYAFGTFADIDLGALRREFHRRVPAPAAG